MIELSKVMSARFNTYAAACGRAAFGCVFVVVAAISTNAAPRAAAAEPDAPDFTSMSLEALGSVKVPMVIGASKHEQKITEAPSAVSIVSHDDIQQQGYRTLSDILRSVRGFYVTYDRGYSAIGVRGVNRPGDYGGRILITIDGHRLNDPIYDSAASGTDFLLDVDLIERVEVIRGPGSSLYGNNAFFGVINVITRKGGDFNGANLAGSAGSLDTHTGRFSYGKNFSNGLELMLSGTLEHAEGNRRLYYAEFDAINRGVAEAMDGGQSRSGFASIAWKGFSLEGGIVRRRKTWPTAPYSSADETVVFNDPRFFTEDDRAFANLSFRHRFDDGWDVMARTYYDHYRFKGQYPVDYFDPHQPIYLNQDIARSESVGTEMQLTRTFFARHRVTAGAEARSDLKLDQKNFDVDPPATYLDTSDSANFFAFYVQDEFRVWPNLIVNAGIRYDRFSTFGDTVNPRVAVIYQPREPTTLKLLYGQAFRAPNAYEYFYTSVTNRRNPSLRSESIRSYELVCEQKLSRKWRGSLSLFFNDINDLIAYGEDPADGSFYFHNVAAVTTKGAEVELEGQWAQGLRGRASYAFARTNNTTTGRRLANSPEHLGKLSLSLPVWREKVIASFELQGMSARDTVSGGAVGAVWLANATLFSRDVVKGLELSASVYNLLGQHYRDPAAPDFTQNSIQQDGRTFRVKLTQRF